MKYKKADHKVIASTVIRTFLYCVLVGGTAFILSTEASSTDRSLMFKEYTMTERIQVIYLFACVVLFILSARIQPSRLSLATLLAGLAMMASIREFDSYLDNHVFDGAWQFFVFLAALLTGFFVYRYRQGLESSIREFTANASFGYMVSAFVTLFVFSRIIGAQSLWLAVMGEDYLRVVKNAVEEGTELLGYSLLLVSAMEFFRESRKDSS